MMMQELPSRSVAVWGEVSMKEAVVVGKTTS